ncbi:MAG: hypothetical protein IPP60_00125 [Sphingobacteriales bacterium]|nr:hypothetical protein [Sphingobacteriales bacterium]
MANFADKRDSQCLPAILDQAINNLAQNDITIAEIGADSAYSSGPALAHVEQNNITAYFRILDNTETLEKDLFTIRNRINMNVNVEIKRYYHLRNKNRQQRL